MPVFVSLITLRTTNDRNLKNFSCSFFFSMYSEHCARNQLFLFVSAVDTVKIIEME